MITINSYKGIPPGKVLSHMLKKRKMTQKQLANHLGIHSQTVSAIITGTRSIPENLSFKLDNEFGYENGFFLLLQAYYTISKHTDTRTPNNRRIPNIRPVVFWDTDMAYLDWQKHKDFIIKRVTQRGSKEELKAVLEYYK